MVKSIVVGFLAMGAISLILADATATSNTKGNFPLEAKNNLNFDKSCSSLKPASYCSPSKIKDRENGKVYSKLWLQDIAGFLLSGSLLKTCNTKFPHQQSLSQASFPSSIKELSKPGCIFSRQYSVTENRSSYQNLNINPDFQADSLVSSFNNVDNSKEFPKLSRSSLIVSLPLSDTTFTPKNTKLANPAPETKRIASPFGWRRRPYSYQRQFHQGIDYGAPLGSPVVAVGNGIVTRVVSGCYDFGNLFCGGQLGNWIEVDHGNGMLGVYGHLKNSSITIKEGMKVWKNQEIAQVGSSGWSTGAHLDFRLKVNGKYEDPAKHLTPPDLLN